MPYHKKPDLADGYYLCLSPATGLYWLATKIGSEWWDGTRHITTWPLGIQPGPLDLPNLARDLAELEALRQERQDRTGTYVFKRVAEAAKETK